MQIILLETLNKLGKAGEIVSVKDGFANNFLIPNKKAIIANKKNRLDLESKISQINQNNEKKIKQANDIKSKLDDIEMIIQMEANEEGNLYGNLGPREIHEQLLKNYSIDISPSDIIVSNVKTLGHHDITIRIYDEIKSVLKIRIDKIK